MAQPRKAPLHVPIAVGVTTSLYALSLAGITALQSQADATARGTQQPMTEALADLTAQRAGLERDLARTADGLSRAAAVYNGSLAEASAFHLALTDLARQVQAATGAAAQVPAQLQLPTAARPATTVTTAPTIHATTGASGQP